MPCCRRSAEAEPTERPVRLAAVVQPRHRFLADVAALLEVHGSLGDVGLGGHRLGAHVESEPRPARLDADDLGCWFAHLHGASGREQFAQARRRVRLRDQIEADVSGDRQHLDPVPVPEALCVLGGEALEPGELAGAGADQGCDRPAVADVLDLDVAADAVRAQVLEDGRGGAGLQIEPDLLVLEA